MPLRTLLTCLTLSPPIFSDLADVQEADVDAGLGELVAQDVVHLVELEVAVADQRDVFFLQLDGGGRALEVEARADFLAGVFHGVFDLDQIGFKNGVERGHGARSLLRVLG
jgi:hypothetical protein